MRAILVLVVSTISALLVFACETKPPEPVVPQPPLIVGDGGAFDEPFDNASSGGYLQPKCAKACANLQTLKCPDGFRREGEDSCYVVCRRATESGKIDFKLDCVIAAKSQDEVRSCKSYQCR